MWRMTFVPHHLDAETIHKTFENREDGVDWLRQNAPDLLAKGVWKCLDESPDWFQYGTNGRWASFNRIDLLP